MARDEAYEKVHEAHEQAREDALAEIEKKKKELLNYFLDWWTFDDKAILHVLGKDNYRPTHNILGLPNNKKLRHF